MMIMTDLDLQLIATYEEFDVPVDQFLANERLTRAFVTSVSRRLGHQDLDAKAVMRRLMNLRKKGRLPRLRRAYHGRNANN